MIARTSQILDEYTHRSHIYSFVYHVGRGIVTIGSLIVPALLSIQGSAESFSGDIYWLTWFLSLLVTTCNGVLTLFKIEKKYYYLHTLVEQVRSEGWQYVHLTGKYGGHHFPLSTHTNELGYFTHALERLKMKQASDEYWKITDKDSEKAAPNGTQLDKKTTDALNVPTPSQEQMMQLALKEQQEQKAYVPPLPTINEETEVDGSESTRETLPV